MGTQYEEAEELGRRSGIVLHVGRLSLAAGTGSYRVKASMARVAKALGIVQHDALVTLTEITTTSRRGSSFRTEVTEVRTISVNTDRLASLERLAQWAERDAPVDPAQVEEKLAAIEAKPALWPPALNAVWAGLACVAFAFLNNAGPTEMAGAFVGATLGQGLRRFMVHRGYNQFGAVIVAAVLAAVSYLGFVGILEAAGATHGPHEVGYVAAVLFLVPGFPLVTGALDLARSDFSAGISRLVYALMVFFSAALALWVVSTALELSPQVPAPWLDEGPTLYAARLVMSAIGVLGFALMFNGTVRMAATAALIACVPNVMRIWLDVEEHWSPVLAAFLAAIAVGLATKLVARRIGVPKITIYVPAVTIMVPGVSAYRAVYNLAQAQPGQALAYGFEAALIVVALAMGLAVARVLTDRRWRYDR